MKKLDPLTRRLPGAILLCGLLFVLGTSGCAHTNRSSAFARVDLLPNLTAVTTGPLAVLLPPGGAFRADFTLTFVSPTEPALQWSGRIFADGGKLRLEAVLDQSHDRRAGAFEVIWDGVAHQGWLVSEALQGYSPVTESVRFTNRLTQVMAGQVERMEGHPVDQASVTLLGGEGQRITLQVSSARDLDGLPLRIHSLDGLDAFTLALSNLQTVRPAGDVFLPPDDFTKFASEAVLADELAARQQNVFGGGGRSLEAGDLNQTGGRVHAGGNSNPP